MIDAGLKRFARIAIFFACAGALQFCFLNPQPEPPGDKVGMTGGRTGGTGGAAGAGPGVGGGGRAGGGGASIDPGRDGGVTPPPPSDAGSSVDADGDVSSDGAVDARGPAGDAPGVDADGEVPGADAVGPDAPSLDAPGSDAQSGDVTDENDGHRDAPDDEGRVDSASHDASHEADAATSNDGAQVDAFDGRD